MSDSRKCIRPIAALAIILVAGAGCAHDPPPTDLRIDPSHERAAEGRPAPVGQALSDETALPEPDRAAAEAPAALLHACPMHPAVRSDKPGRCPQCGMKLEQVKDAKAHEGHR